MWRKRFQSSVEPRPEATGDEDGPGPWRRVETLGPQGQLRKEKTHLIVTRSRKRRASKMPGQSCGKNRLPVGGLEGAVEGAEEQASGLSTEPPDHRDALV